MLELATPVQYVKGVGPRVAQVLAEKGINTVEDLLYYLPFRYEDRLNPRTIAELQPGETASVIAEVRTSALFRTRRMPIFEITAAQGRASLKCIWFHGAYLKDRFKPGQTVALYGKVEADRRRMRAQPGIAFQVDERVREALKKILPFHPTAAQKRVLK